MTKIFLSPNAFPKYKSTKMVGQFHDYLYSRGSKQVFPRGIETENMKSCVGVVLQSPKGHVVCHGAPEQQALSTIQKALQKHIEALKAPLDQIHAFVCGGWATGDKEANASFELARTTLEVLDNLKIPNITAICGKQKGSGLDHVHSSRGGIFMWGDNFKNVKPEDVNTREKLVDFLEDKYQMVEIHDNHGIQFLKDFSEYVAKP